MTETPEAVESEAPEAAPEITESEAMDAKYDEIMSRGEESAPARDERGRFVAAEAPAETAEAPEGDDGEGEAVEAAVEASEEAEEDFGPSKNLPSALRDVWKDIPESARDAIEKSHKRMADDLGEMGRRDAAIRPIYDSVVRAAKELPVMANMSPQEIAENVFELAQIQTRLHQDPVQTIWEVAGRFGVQQQLAAALTGQQGGQPQGLPVEAYQAQIAQLEQKIESLVNPERLQGMIDETIGSRTVESEVERFAAENEHWDAVEHLIPSLLPAVKETLGEGAAPGAVLTRAYDMAVKALDLKTPPKSKPVASEKVEAAKRAASVNVTSASNGRPRQLTEQELMAQKYDELMAS